MHAKAVEIAWHDDSPIWSVDISPSNRVVTASGDKVARVWKFHDEPYSVLSGQEVIATGQGEFSLTQSSSLNSASAFFVNSCSKTTSKQLSKISKLSSIRLDAALVEWLCDLRAHATTINVARFSPDGLAIATAADHGEIVIWRLDTRLAEPSSLFAMDDEQPKERWQCDATLRGHVQDVLDLVWTADGSRLVSASVDNTVMVWDVHHPSRTPVALRNHNNFVQGVSIDPFGRLIASMGNDRALRVFTASSNTWVQVASVASLSPDARLFVDDSKFKNFFRRLTWSPDGSVLACPSGLHLPKQAKRLFSVHIFARNRWTSPAVQCGGLPSPPCAVRFNPVLYQLRNTNVFQSEPLRPQGVQSGIKRNGPFHAFTYRMIFAVACVHSVLFYDTEYLTRPFAFVEGLHCAEHTDLTWSADGQTVLVSSVDGYISAICFTEKELGQPLSTEEIPAWLRKQERIGSETAVPQHGQKPIETTTVCPRVLETTYTVAEISTCMGRDNQKATEVTDNTISKDKKRPLEHSVEPVSLDKEPHCEHAREESSIDSPRAATRTITSQGYRITPPGPQVRKMETATRLQMEADPSKYAPNVNTMNKESYSVANGAEASLGGEVSESMPAAQQQNHPSEQYQADARNPDTMRSPSPSCCEQPQSPLQPPPGKKPRLASSNAAKRRNKSQKIQTKFVFSKGKESGAAVALLNTSNNAKDNKEGTKSAEQANSNLQRGDIVMSDVALSQFTAINGTGTSLLDSGNTSESVAEQVENNISPTTMVDLT